MSAAFYRFMPNLLALWMQYSYKHYYSKPCDSQDLYYKPCRESLMFKYEYIPAFSTEWALLPEVKLAEIVIAASLLLLTHNLYSLYRYPQTETIQKFLLQPSHLTEKDRQIFKLIEANPSLQLDDIPYEPVTVEYQTAANTTAIHTVMERDELIRLFKANQPLPGTKISPYSLRQLQLTPDTHTQKLIREVYEKRLQNLNLSVSSPVSRAERMASSSSAILSSSEVNFIYLVSSFLGSLIAFCLRYSNWLSPELNDSIFANIISHEQARLLQYQARDNVTSLFKIYYQNDYCHATYGQIQGMQKNIVALLNFILFFISIMVPIAALVFFCTCRERTSNFNTNVKDSGENLKIIDDFYATAEDLFPADEIDQVEEADENYWPASAISPIYKRPLLHPVSISYTYEGHSYTTECNLKTVLQWFTYNNTDPTNSLDLTRVTDLRFHVNPVHVKIINQEQARISARGTPTTASVFAQQTSNVSDSSLTPN
jgi:hypothetical protein